MNTKDEAERLAEEHSIRTIPYDDDWTENLIQQVPRSFLRDSAKDNYEEGFRAGEKSELVQRLVGALDEISRPHKIGGSSLEEWLRCHTAAKNALASFNASPEEKK